MIPGEHLFYERALARIGRWMLAITAAGMLAGVWHGGWRWSAGFLVGSLASYFSFRALKRVVEHLGAATEQKPPRARVAVVMALRYAALAAGGYVILRFTALSLTAALSGLFISAAAVILEIIYELIYART